MARLWCGALSPPAYFYTLHLSCLQSSQSIALRWSTEIADFRVPKSQPTPYHSQLALATRHSSTAHPDRLFPSVICKRPNGRTPKYGPVYRILIIIVRKYVTPEPLRKSPEETRSVTLYSRPCSKREAVCTRLSCTMLNGILMVSVISTRTRRPPLSLPPLARQG